MGAFKVEVRHRIGLFAALVVALGLKAWLVLAGRVPFNSDEAVIGLMARHILQGERPVFFYGQAYMGSLDAFLVAAGFWLFGQQVWVIRLVQALLYLGILVTTAWLGRVVFGSWKIGVLAAWLLAIPTINTTLYTTASLGGYGEALLIGNLILLAGFRIAELMFLEAPWSQWARMALLWGFLVGLGLWVFGLTLVYTLPMTLYLAHLWRFYKGRLKSGKPENGLASPLPALGFILLGFVLGSSPWWLFALRYGPGKLLYELGGGAIAGVEQASWLAQIGQHLVNFFVLGISVIFGLRPPWNVGWLGLPLLPFVLVFWSTVLVFSFKSLRTKRPVLRLEAVLAGVILTVLAGFLLTPFGADPSGRYFLPLAVPLALFAAEMILDVREKLGFWAWGLAALVLVYNLWGTLQSAQRNPPGITTQFYEPTQVDRRYDAELVDFLRRHGEKLGYGNYWVTYPLAFLSQEELVFVPRLPYHLDFRYTERDDRYPPYGERVAQAGGVAYITTRHPALDQHLRRSFTRLGVTWQEAQIGDYHIFYNLSSIVRPHEVDLGRTGLDSPYTGSL